MKWKGHWGCPSLEHQVYSEREVGPVTGTHTKTLGFGEAAESIKAIQEISVMLRRNLKSKTQNTAGRQRKILGSDNKSRRSDIKGLEKVFQLA